MKVHSIQKRTGPDGVEAWCVALAACLINFIMAGLGRMSGILYVAFIDIFQIDRKQASLPFSVRMSVRNLVGPVVGILGQKYGVRNVTLIGGIMGTISAMSCFYVKDILWVTVLWGAINGFGTSLTTTLPQVVIGQHFKKYRSTASGMAFSGGCVGSFLFPALLEFFLHSYGLGGTFLIIAGIIMHTIPAAMILRKPTWLKQLRDDIKIATINNVPVISENAIDACPKIILPDISAESGDIVPQLILGCSGYNKIQGKYLNGDTCGSISNSNNILSTIDTLDIELLREHSNTVVEILIYVSTVKHICGELNVNCFIDKKHDLSRDIERLYSKIEQYKRRGSVLGVGKPEYAGVQSDVNRPSHNFYNMNARNDFATDHSKSNPRINVQEDLSLHMALRNVIEADSKDILVHFPEQKHDQVIKITSNLCNLSSFLDSDMQSISSVKTEGTFSNILNSSGKEDTKNTFLYHIKTALRLYLNPLFLLICLCRTVHSLTFMPVVTTIVDFSMDKGLLQEDGVYVIAALSFGDLMGRLCLGWITDRGYLSLPRYMMLVMVLQGVSTASMPMMQSRGSVMAAIAVFGLLQGSVFVRHPVLVSKYLRSQEQSIAMGCMNFFSGILGFALPIYIGYFRDNIGSYNGMFYISGGIGASVGLLWVFEPFFRKFSGFVDDEVDASAV